MVLDDDDFDDFFQDLSPDVYAYLFTGDVSCEQVTAARDAGLSNDDISERLLDAECFLIGVDSDYYRSGWQSATTDISNLNYSGDQPETIADLGQQAQDRTTELRRECYASHLYDHNWDQGLLKFSHWRGRRECCESGRRYLRDVDNDITDDSLASLLRANPDWHQMHQVIARTLDEIREVEAREQAVSVSQMLRPVWTPFGNLRHDQIAGL